MERTYVEQYVDLWHNHWWWRSRHRFVLGLLEELARRRTARGGRLRLLDVGCCGGVAFDDWSRFGEVWGIEPDRKLAASTPKWTHRVTHTSLEAFEAPEEPFDLVVLLDVLEHIEDDRAALRRLAGLLAPGGALLATVPALPILWSAHDEANDHFRRYRRGELGRRLEDAGLVPERLHFFFGWIVALLLVRRVLPRGRRPYRVRVPPAPVNAFFERCCRVENWLIRTAGLVPPIGSSLIAVAGRRPA